MARASTFSALFIVVGLSYALWGAFGAHIGVRPPSAASLRSMIDHESCPAGHYECPEDSKNAKVLIYCSLSEQGKLQCLYGDTTSSAMDGSLGNIATENGVNTVPTIDVCSYSFLSGQLQFATTTACRPSAVVRTVYSGGGNALGVVNQREYIPEHPIPNPHQPKTRRIALGDVLLNLKARLVDAILEKRDGDGNNTISSPPNNATGPDTNATTFGNHDY